jgi:DNA-binding NarL/FixJ family response regulator
MEPVTIVIVDDHTLFRQGTRALLHTDPDLKVVGEGETGDEVLELVQRHRPKIVLMDVEMPGLGPKATIPRVAKICPESAIIILTMHVASLIVRELIECGAAAYLMKTITREELISTVRSVNGGPGNIILSVPRETIKSFEQQERNALLSERELEVLVLVSRAMSNAQIATRLHLSEGTVKRHLTNIYGKLGAVSRVDAIKKAAAAEMIAI